MTCRVLKLARQPYCRWLAHPVTARELRQAYLANALFGAHRDDPEFGHRLLPDEAGQAGQHACDRTVWAICSANGWWSAFGKKRGKNGKKPGPPAHADLVEHDFTATSPNRLWLTDITEHPTGEGKIHLCAIKDVFSNRDRGLLASATGWKPASPSTPYDRPSSVEMDRWPGASFTPTAAASSVPEKSCAS